MRGVGSFSHKSNGKKYIGNKEHLKVKNMKVLGFDTSQIGELG